MLGYPIYINGFSSINPVTETAKEGFLYRSVEPDYKAFLEPTAIRRLGRLQKMALVCAKNCLQDAGNEKPEAIITGTAMGCLEDTEKFLEGVLSGETNVHSPTSFIQSTHNTVSGQIAIMLQCHGYNNTFAHRSLSFERALEDAQMLLIEKEASSILVGSVEEMSVNTHRIAQKIGLFKANSDTPAPIAGEGVHFFMCSNTPSHTSKAILKSFESIEGEVNPETVNTTCVRFLEANKINASEIDAVILGLNGDLPEDQYYTHFADRLFPHSSLLHFKKFTGESFGASAFAIVLACQAFKGETGDRFFLRKTNQAIRTILVYNHFQGTNHSFFLLQHV